jgi:hypothetical protein
VQTENVGIGSVMIVEDMKGEHDIQHAADLDKLFLTRYGDGFNVFFLSHGKAKGPELWVLVNKRLATLHYFPPNDHHGFYSDGRVPELDPKEDTVFFMNSLIEKEEFPNHKVVPFSNALAAAKEFLASPELPPSIEWVEH